MIINVNETLQQATRLHQAGQMQEAARLYQSILQTHPHNTDANHNLGLLAMQVGQPASGLVHLQNAWRNNPNIEQYCVTLTECLLRIGRSDDALKVIKNAMERKNFGSAPAKHLLQLAASIVNGQRPALSTEFELLTSFNARDHVALEEKLTAVLIQYPNWNTGWNLLATTLEIQGKECDEALDRAVQFMPANAQQQKIFCIGANKTGTTSVEHVLRSLGLSVGNQEQAEMLLYDWAKQDYRRIIGYCQSAQAFQDVPFSLHGTYRVLDEAFPRSKFILTVRNNSDEWYQSLVRFHSKIVGKGRIPTANDLRQFNYRFPGYVLDVMRLSYGIDESGVYDPERYVQYYEQHNDQVKEYFASRPNDLLVLNVEHPDAIERLVKFLGFSYTGQKMPHANSSKD
jgi:tetratricopeptide (TPR) repeat protein